MQKQVKSRSVAMLLAFFFGGFGIHRFYVGQVGWGLVFLLFCWTFVPAFIAIADLIRWIAISKEEFAERYS